MGSAFLFERSIRPRFHQVILHRKSQHQYDGAPSAEKHSYNLAPLLHRSLHTVLSV